MRTISVAGATSKSGKTLLAEQIIRYCADRYQPVYAVKFSTTSDIPSPCPRGAPCNVCDLTDVFRIVRDAGVLMEKGKNTERLAAAGATEVIWVISRKSCLEKAYLHLLTHLPENAIVVMEGSSVTEFCHPDLLFYIFANHIPRSRWKESAPRILATADFVIRNRKQGYADTPVQAPEGTLTLDLRETGAQDVPEIQERLDLFIRSTIDVVRNQ